MAAILIADDDPRILAFLRIVLESDGHHVTSAADGQEALERVAQSLPDLVMLDLDMPRLGGFEVCSRLKQSAATRLVPIVILTGRDPRDARVPAWEFGADEFLSKPAHPHEVLARCRSLLRLKALVDERDSAEAVVLAFAKSVEARCVFTHGHSERVARYAVALGKDVGLSAAELETLRRGAALHDVGKLGLPDAILNKPEPLTDEEFAIVKRHPMQGVRILEQLRSLNAVLPMVRWHHERLDGRGYPDGLAGNAIPTLVRILSVADVYDAVSSDRPYRSAMPQPMCFEVLRADAADGGLDSDLVSRFCQCTVAN